ncbi:pyridoxamine 5'-phosphate oxidase [Palleronia sediminis]|uniref:Pyridoxamine 5'-phosphate oxidase n=1 Tax=Palleronia sediminis TaxID=2547833 RepID=A0A4R6AAB5_9RHOB|nr:pyridoxamine 5'-phosphate oxidase family protein [Palleronia sediminis]TDL79674.1 pyridoxamine 5'-phosphate oxidase [Palleronia sediminis]
MSEPTLGAFLAGAWDILATSAGGAGDARQAALASIGPDGGPRVRTVILRAADRAEAAVELHTDLASAKIDELRAEPRAALLFWSAERQVQIRARGPVAILTGAAVEDRWRDVPDAARANYGGAPVPLTPLDAPGDWRETRERARFAVLRMEIDALDLVRLGARHLRATYDAADGFTGQWRAP